LSFPFFILGLSFYFGDAVLQQPSRAVGTFQYRLRGDLHSLVRERVAKSELTPKGRALITRGFGAHAAPMEAVAGVLSKNKRLTLLRHLKKLGKHAAETHK